MANNDIGREFGWNDTIQNDSEFEPVPEGDYDFEVVGFERGRHPGSDKLPPCNKAVLDIRVTNAAGDSGTVRHNLFLHSRCEGMLCAFFVGIGQRQKGEALVMDWNKVIGARGRCKVGQRKWTGNDGSERVSNEIKCFYDPPEKSGAAKFTPGAF
jgi:hypothetical protein